MTIILIIVIGIVVIVSALYLKGISSAAVNLSQDQAFLKLKEFLSGDFQSSTAKSEYPELSQIAKLSKASDPVERFQSVAPALTAGKDLVSPSSSAEVGLENIFGKKSDLNVERSYWVFAWHSPGVIDHDYTFYVDARSGDVVLMTAYSSPD